MLCIWKQKCISFEKGMGPPPNCKMITLNWILKELGGEWDKDQWCNVWHYQWQFGFYKRRKELSISLATLSVSMNGPGQATIVTRESKTEKMRLLKLEQGSWIHTFLTNSISTVPQLVNRTAGILRNQKVQYRVQKSPLLVSIMNHTNSVHAIT
jgi:hypothetical protein